MRNRNHGKQSASVIMAAAVAMTMLTPVSALATEIDPADTYDETIEYVETSEEVQDAEIQEEAAVEQFVAGEGTPVSEEVIVETVAEPETIESSPSTRPVTSVTKTDGTWYYYVDGSIDYAYSGLAANENGLWFISNGTVDFDRNAEYSGGGGWTIEGGKVKDGQVVEFIQEAGAVGNDNNSFTGKLIVGDSRCMQLYIYDGYSHFDKASIVSRWDGSYIGTAEIPITTSENIEAMIKYVNESLSLLGYCDIYLFPPTAEYLGGDGYIEPVDAIISLGVTLSGCSAEFEGQTVSPTIHMMTLTSGINDYAFDASAYNGYLQEQASANGFDFINTGACLSGDNDGFSTDGLHYNNETLNNIWNVICSEENTSYFAATVNDVAEINAETEESVTEETLGEDAGESSEATESEITEDAQTEETDESIEITESEASEDTQTENAGESVEVVESETTSESEEVEASGASFTTSDGEVHSNLTYHEYKEATSSSDGHIEYYYCMDCGKYFTSAGQEITESDTIVHLVTSVKAKAATTESEGNIAYYHCQNCGQYFDESGNVISESSVVLPMLEKTDSETVASENTSASTASTGSNVALSGSGTTTAAATQNTKNGTDEIVETDESSGIIISSGTDADGYTYDLIEGYDDIDEIEEIDDTSSSILGTGILATGDERNFFGLFAIIGAAVAASAVVLKRRLTIS